MARLTSLFRFQFRAYHRSLADHPLNRGEKMLVSWAAVAMALRYVANCLFAAGWVEPGKEIIGRQIVLFNLLYILLFWLIVPFLLSGTDPSHRRTSLGRLLSLPLSRGHIFIITVSNIIIRPIYGILFGLTLAGLIPVFFTMRVCSVLAAGILFSLFCLALSICVSLAAEAAVHGRLLRHLLRLAVPFTMLTAIGLNIRFLVTNQGLQVMAGMEKIFWFGTGTETGWSGRFTGWSPADWAVRAMDPVVGLPWMVLLGGGILICAGMAWILFRRSLSAAGPAPFTRTAKRRSRGGGGILLFGLGLKEQRYAFRSGDLWVGLAVSLFFSFQILFSRTMTEHIFVPLLPLVFLLNAAAAFNSFGLDRGGFGRYLAGPVLLVRVLKAKNAHFLAVVGIQLLPIVTSSFVRFGGAPVLRLAVNLLVALMVVAISGNFLSLYMPVPRTCRGFVTFHQSGGVAAAGTIVATWWLLFSLDTLFDFITLIMLKLIILAGLVFLYLKLLPLWERVGARRNGRIREDLSI